MIGFRGNDLSEISRFRGTGFKVKGWQLSKSSRYAGLILCMSTLCGTAKNPHVNLKIA